MTYVLVLTYPDSEPSVYGPFDSPEKAYAFYSTQADVDCEQYVVELFHPANL